ncbi:MAG TPA: SGNH/GDSL hydrolase family protein, partial [Bacteroidia bacterium]|nr:SGNH/GDSL hydrolase family protein [Bacteroidia bacterium]
MNWETLMCFGDSITIGARSYCGYPEYAGNLLEKKLGNNWNVINLAVCGYTAMDLARYISSNFSNLKQFEPGIISILIGTNDVKKNTLPSDFEIAYRQVILKALLLSCNRNVVLIKLPFFPKNVAYPYNFGMNNKVDSCNEIIDQLAVNYNLRAMEFHLNDADLFDGVHLN